MIGYQAHADPPTLADRLRALNDSLRSLAGRLKDAIASAVSSAIGSVIRDVLRKLLGAEGEPPEQPRSFDQRFGQDRYDPDHRLQRYEDDPWHDDDSWHEDSHATISPSHDDSDEPNRWGDALRATVQTALWWLRIQPFRRPLLTTTLVALTAGGAAFFAGPTLASCVSVIASVASLLLTAESVRTASEVVTSAVR
jgi:hypothetical protein